MRDSAAVSKSDTTPGGCFSRSSFVLGERPFELRHCGNKADQRR